MASVTDRDVLRPIWVALRPFLDPEAGFLALDADGDALLTEEAERYLPQLAEIAGNAAVEASLNAKHLSDAVPCLTRVVKEAVVLAAEHPGASYADHAATMQALALLVGREYTTDSRSEG